MSVPPPVAAPSRRSDDLNLRNGNGALGSGLERLGQDGSFDKSAWEDVCHELFFQARHQLFECGEGLGIPRKTPMALGAAWTRWIRVPARPMRGRNPSTHRRGVTAKTSLVLAMQGTGSGRPGRMMPPVPAAGHPFLIG